MKALSLTETVRGKGLVGVEERDGKKCAISPKPGTLNVKPHALK